MEFPPIDFLITGFAIISFALALGYTVDVLLGGSPPPWNRWMLQCPVEFHPDNQDIAVLIGPKGQRVPVYRELFWYYAHTGDRVPSKVDLRLDQIRFLKTTELPGKAKDFAETLEALVTPKD